MIITCEECATRFVLDNALIKPDGSMVRCSKCRHVFTAYPKDYPEIGLPDQSESKEQDIPFDESQYQNQFDLNLSQGDDSDRDSVSHSQGDEAENKEIDFSEIEFEVEAFEETPQKDTDASDTRDLEIEFQDTTKDFDEDVLEFDTADFEIDEPELDFQDDGLELETHEIAPESASEEADIEISVDQDDAADLELGELSVDMEAPAEEAPSFDELELETQNADDSDLELEDDAQEDLILEEEDDDDGLALSPAPEDALTDDFALQQEETVEAQPDIAQDDFSSDDIEIKPDDSDEMRDDEHADEKMEQIPSDQDKFAEYDTVLEQETEPEEASITIPETDEEDDTPAPPLSPEDDEIKITTETPIEPAASITPLSAQSVRQKRRSKKKKGVSPAVKILLVLVLLLLAAYVAIIRLGITIPVVSDIQIPFISQWLAPKQAPQAPLKPVLDEPSIEGRFVSNKSAGDLFIVTGKVKNPSDKAVSFIRVKGTLMKKNNIKAGTQIAYCGNIISDETLKSDNISDITNQMGVKQGNQNLNVNIKPGAEVRFMLVFSNLPEDLANFTVALEGFEPAQE